MKRRANLVLVIVAMLGLLVLCGAAWAVEPNLVSHWKFDEGSGTTAYDSAGDNHGTVYGATWTSGQIDGALEFDGDGDYVSLPDLDFGSTLTISVWLYNEDATAYRQGIVTQGTNSNNFVSLGTGSTNQVVFFIKNSGTQNTAPESIALEQNKWIHYVGVLNSTDILLYKNGVLNNSATQTVNPPIMTGDTRIAHDDGIWGSGDKYFNGTIDDVRIYDRALSAVEIRQLYLDGFSSYERAVIQIEDAIAEKEEMLDVIGWMLEEERDAYAALEELLESGDYGDLKKGDIVQAMQKIHSAMQHQEQSIDTLEKSIEKLEDVLAALGWEPEPEPDLPEP